MKLEELGRAYHEKLDANRLPYLECDVCGHRFYYPRKLCPRCSSTSLQVRESDGRGKIFSLTRIQKKDGGKTTYGIVELDGFRIYCNILEKGKADLGKEVSMVFVELKGRKYPVAMVDA
ncbi:MAG: nucleic acid-binding protein [Nitrososphaerota archaeon]|nr:nucleic acid-binding protein [Nitrososphaerota archaeon]MDG6959050.1 nucleic acid-binding protein [Nitrososphaerota archaeon]MDG6980976.1 nucleic acid-binding protein [Nitrososphaerota archaeon]